MTRRDEGSLSSEYGSSRRSSYRRKDEEYGSYRRRDEEYESYRRRGGEDYESSKKRAQISYSQEGWNKRRRRRSSRHHSKGRSSTDRVGSKRRHKEYSKRRGEDNRAPGTTPLVQTTDEGHLIYKRHDMLDSRYEICRELGEGTFGKVVLCKDGEQTDKRVAIKIIRNISKYRDAAKIEIQILEKIRSNENCQGCVEMLSSFDYHGHTCIVFETLGKSVFDFLKDNGFTPFPLAHVQRMGDDLLQSLKSLHGMKYTHTDLKPENVLFIDSDYESVHDQYRGMTVRHVLDPSVKVIDFGSATHEKEHHSRIVSTRHYRAPEVIAEIGWSYPCDLWSVGCILFELYTGHTLFQTHDNREHLGMMEYMLGTIPSWVCKLSDKRYFKKDRLDFNKHGSSGRYIRKYCKKLGEYRRDDAPAHVDFFDLLWALLEYDPERRVTASHALEHPFFDRQLSERDNRSHKSR